MVTCEEWSGEMSGMEGYVGVDGELVERGEWIRRMGWVGWWV